ncbi:MAG: (2Fe-2S)-binding protein [Rhodospirillaceae bacterium]|mgnify:CR=1 FL=1|nr:(2Fe-2S)-binding protein [Rhodospirillaceae bacterium]MDD9917722.1 (2Fe-2S)-binding protein [Rhodospirillaceae bacterium]MDD9926637.1 (2Fe-2S)-binding protein [Rhodospirillaceae bacterium]
MQFTVKVNGVERKLDLDEDTPLLWALRDTLGITGPKFGCGIAACGACTVYLDGEPTRSCVTTIDSVGDAEVTTIDSLQGKAADAVREAWVALDVPQCGYCQSGQIMAATALLTETPKPSDDEIDAAMEGNVCRCATYHRIRAGIHRAAEILEG